MTFFTEKLELHKSNFRKKACCKNEVTLLPLDKFLGGGENTCLVPGLSDKFPRVGVQEFPRVFPHRWLGVSPHSFQLHMPDGLFHVTELGHDPGVAYDPAVGAPFVVENHFQPRLAAIVLNNLKSIQEEVADLLRCDYLPRLPLNI